MEVDFEVSFAQVMLGVALSSLLLPVDQDEELSAPSPAPMSVYKLPCTTIMIMD